MPHHEFDHDDPMELKACGFPDGDPEFQARVFVEEYAGIGMRGDDIFALFADSAYPGVHRLFGLLGPDKILDLIRGVTVGRVERTALRR